MSRRIGVHLRVTGDNNQGGRKYMEDCFSVAYQHTDDQSDLEYAYFGIFDGHGGSEAAFFAKHNLMDYIVAEKGFWSTNDSDVLNAIREGFIKTHKNMWRIQDEWPKTASGLPSTAGTTASIAFVRHGKIYTGHVGDSGIILGYQSEENSSWLAMPLTEDHKPESAAEKARIESNGGKVVIKSGVPRVVWNKPRIVEGHKGPIRKNTPVDEIPFLAVARSLGDLWSYNPENKVFVVSPEPDVAVRKIDVDKYRCLIFGTDGLWNMVTPQQAITIVEHAETHNKSNIQVDNATKNVWINPSKRLVEEALLRWSNTRMHADNITVVALMLDPPGTPKRRVVRKIIDPQAVQQCSQEAISCNTFCSNESTKSLPKIKPLNIISPTVNQENIDMEESFTNPLDCSNNPANFSTPYDSISDMEDSKNISDAVYTNLEKMNVENVTNEEYASARCADEEEPHEDFSTFMIDFNKEYITNVIFGPLPNNTIYPEPTFTNLSIYDNALDSDETVKIPEKKDEDLICAENAVSSKSTTNDDENKNVKVVNLNDVDIPECNQRKNDSVADSVSIKSYTLLHTSVEEDESSATESKQILDSVESTATDSEKSESIQIHEISSSCAAQDIVKPKVKGHKLHKPRKMVSKRLLPEKANGGIMKEKITKTSTVSKRKSERKFTLNNTQTENQKHLSAIPKKNKVNVFLHKSDPKLNNPLFPRVILEDCSLQRTQKSYKKSSDVGDSVNLLESNDFKNLFSDFNAETNNMKKIKSNYKTKLVCSQMVHGSSKSNNKVQRSTRSTRSKTKTVLK